MLENVGKRYNMLEHVGTCWKSRRETTIKKKQNHKKSIKTAFMITVPRCEDPMPAGQMELVGPPGTVIPTRCYHLVESASQRPQRGQRAHWEPPKLSKLLAKN